MATSSKKRKPVATFDFTVHAAVYLPEFTPFASLKALDPEAFKTGKHRIEIGMIEGGCCRKVAYAVVQKGMVVKIETTPCEDSKRKPPKEVAALFAKAKALAKGLGTWEPIPVSELAAVAFLRPTRVGTGAGCVYVCIWDYCVFCCISPPRCWIEERIGSPDIVLN